MQKALTPTPNTFLNTYSENNLQKHTATTNEYHFKRSSVIKIHLSRKKQKVDKRAAYHFGHLGHGEEEALLQLLGHDGDVVAGLVVHVAVGEHGVEVLHTLLGRPVLVRLQLLLDGAQVHRLLDDLEVVLETRCNKLVKSSWLHEHKSPMNTDKLYNQNRSFQIFNWTYQTFIRN